MWLGDACGAFATFAMGTSIALGAILFVVASVTGASLFMAAATLAEGVLLIIPLGLCGITIAWRLTLGLQYSMRIRPGDFRFAGIFVPALVWGSSALGEYLMHLPAGHALALAGVWPLLIGAMTTWNAALERRRIPRSPMPANKQAPEPLRSEV